MSKTKFHLTPDYRVVTTIATKDAADALLAELQSAGFNNNDGHIIGMHHGEQGKDFIDPDGSRHGFFARLSRAVQRLPSWEASMLEQVEDALNTGQYVASVLTDDSKQQRLQIRDIMQKHTSERIYYRGNYSMEILSEARDVSSNQWSQQVVHIEPFAVDLASAPDFLSQWQQEAKKARAHQGMLQAQLHQSIEADPHYRFLNMARWASSAVFTGEGKQHLYHQVMEQVGQETDYQEHVYVVNFIEVSSEEADTFVQRWSELSLPIAQMEGFIWATLYRAVESDARYQFVNYSQWNSPEAHSMFKQQAASAPKNIIFNSGLYRVAMISNDTL